MWDIHFLNQVVEYKIQYLLRKNYKLKLKRLGDSYDIKSYIVNAALYGQQLKLTKVY